jgi:hypothetical protein
MSHITMRKSLFNLGKPRSMGGVRVIWLCLDNYLTECWSSRALGFIWAQLLEAFFAALNGSSI